LGETESEKGKALWEMNATGQVSGRKPQNNSNGRKKRTLWGKKDPILRGSWKKKKWARRKAPQETKVVNDRESRIHQKEKDPSVEPKNSLPKKWCAQF